MQLGKKSSSAPIEKTSHDSDEAIEAKLQHLMVELAVPPDKRAEMQAWNIAQKRQLIETHKATKAKKNKDPGSYIAVLQSVVSGSKSEVKLLSKLKINLSSSAVSWVGSFATAGGISALFNSLSKLLATNIGTNHLVATLECLQAIKAAMNSGVGLKAVMDFPNSCGLLMQAASIEVSYGASGIGDVFKIVGTSMEMLAAIGLAPPIGHRLLMESANLVCEKKDERRFIWILNSLWTGLKFIPDSISALVAAVALLNVIVNAPDELRGKVIV